MSSIFSSKVRRATLWVTLAGVATFIAIWGGYVIVITTPPVRHAVPVNMAEDAMVPGFPDIRFWGDEITATFERMMLAQYKQVVASARGGWMPDALEKVDFISISGGGEDGAFAAGYLDGWSESGKRPIFECVSGVSTGALEAPFVFLGPEWNPALREIYTKTPKRALYRSRGALGFFSNALDSTTPLESVIRHYVTEHFLDLVAVEYRKGRRLQVMSTNLDAQRPMIWDLTAIAASGRPDRLDLFVDVLLASSAIPGVFPPRLIKVVGTDGKTYEELHVDGGVTAEAIFAPPQTRLSMFEKEAFGHQRDRTLYVIRNGKIGPEYAVSAETTLGLTRRGVATLVKYQVLSNLRVLDRAAIEGGTHFFFASIPEQFSTLRRSDFDEAYAEALFQEGRKAGSTVSWSTTLSNSPQLELQMGRAGRRER